MKDTVLLSNFSRLRSNAGDTVKKEVALNLLEDMLLYVRVRTFSFVKDKEQLHKMKAPKLKSRSLRADLKKKSNILEEGH